MSVVHVRHVTKTLVERFSDHIDMSDLNGREDIGQQKFLSRALSALAVQMEHPCTNAEAARAVFDGNDDHGLDAVSIDLRQGQPRICLVQAKWSDKGRATFGEDEVHKMVEGLDLILNLQFNLFNRRFQQHVPALEDAFDRGTPKITLALALMRTEPVNHNVCGLLEKKIGQYNQVDEMIDYKILDLRDFHRAILGDAAAPKINTRIQIEGFGLEASPYQAVYGTMTVPSVAALYGNHHHGLFARNIRDALDLTDVNVKIRGTLLEEPAHLWYFSNGITMLCDSIKQVPSLSDLSETNR